MKEIQLTQGQVALVDDADYDLVSSHNWHAVKHYNTFYASTAHRRSDGKPTTMRMHKLILKDVKLVDHEDGNGLNNQRYNLRSATNGQSSRNRRKQSTPTSSKYKGVSWNIKNKRWVALIGLGSFMTEEAAAKAYDAAAIHAFGSFASLNFSKEIDGISKST